MAAFSEVKLLLCLFITSPAVENICSVGTDVGGIHEYRLANSAT